MYRFSLAMITICGLGLCCNAQSSGQVGSTESVTAAPQTGVSTSGATSLQGANISQKGKEDDKNPSTPGIVQSAASNSGGTQVSEHSNPASAPSGAGVQAVLNRSIDSKKAKQGDEVTAKTTEDVKVSSAVSIPKNSKLIGHVTEVKAYEKGKSESRVAIVFDKAVLKGGKEVPVHAMIQAIAPPDQVAMPMDNGAPSAPMGNSPGNQSNGGLVGGAARTAGAEVGSVADTAGGVASNAGAVAGSSTSATGASLPGGANAGLNSNSQGVLGIRDVRLTAVAGSSTQGSVLTSGSGNVHLDGGTRLVLRVSEQ